MTEEQSSKIEGTEEVGTELEIGEEESVEGNQAEPQATVAEEAEVSGGDEPQATEDEEPVDELEALRQELEDARAREAEYLDGWQRARAELANARKRFQRDQEQAYTNAKVGIFAYVLPIVDDFERAFESLPKDLSNVDWVEGMRLVQHKLQRLLEQEGVEPIDVVDQEFDPFLHEAVTHEPSETIPEGQIIAALQQGYRLGERVLRPSVVRVSSGPVAEPEPAAEGAAPDQEETTDES